MERSENGRPIPRANAFKAIFWGGLIAGILDGADAVVFLGWMSGVPPARVFQFIASGLLGTIAFRYGWTAVAVGVTCHFVIATGAAAVYYALTFRWPSLLRKPTLIGPVFGLGAFFFMHYLVVPLSATPKQPPLTLSTYVNLVLSHILFVGLPIALIASWYARPSLFGIPKAGRRSPTHGENPA